MEIAPVLAGLGEACSHIAVLLFTLEKCTQHQKMATCTALPCSWLPPSCQTIMYSEIADIDFATPQLKRRRSESNDCPLPSASMTNKVTPPSDQELTTLYKDLFQAGKPVSLSLIPEYSDHYVPLIHCVQTVFCQALSLISSTIATLIYHIPTY